MEPNEGVDVSNKEFNKEETSGEDMDEIHEELFIKKKRFMRSLLVKVLM